jgi:hypothetical protein
MSAYLVLHGYQRSQSTPFATFPEALTFYRANRSDDYVCDAELLGDGYDVDDGRVVDGLTDDERERVEEVQP